MNSIPARHTLPTATKDVLTCALGNFYSDSGELNNSPLRCLPPILWDLWLLPYMADFTDMIKLRILRWGDDPGLSGWALNAIPGVLIRERQREIWHREKRRGHVTIEAKVREMWPQTKECWQPPEAGRGGNQILPKILQREPCPANTPTAVHWGWAHTSGL